jgi:outer membrane protein OmpA-like peptidoglycan-associated protein
MEQRFGHDFSRVRVHTDAPAAESARAVQALAYTVGQEVVFGHGNYNPSSHRGYQLVSHELVHTLQQSAAPTAASHGLKIASGDGRSEREAERQVQLGPGARPAAAAVTPAGLALQRACGPAAIGSVAGCTPRGGDITDFGGSSANRFRFAPGCDQLLPGERERVLELARRLTPFHLVEVDGFASEEGPPEFNADLSCARAHALVATLSSAGPFSVRVTGLYQHGATSGARDDRRSAVVSVRREQRSIEPSEQNLLDRLEQLALDAVSEAARSQSVRFTWQVEQGFSRGVREFKRTLKQRLEALPAGEPLPDDLRFVMEALLLWSRDSGNQWGEGIWDSQDLVMSAADYATVPAGQYKCNAYVAEVAYRSVGIVQRAIASQGQPGRFFPHQARDWGNAKQAIPNFPVVTGPQLGDIWSNGSHTGIYLGTYAGHRLYISARDDSEGVWGLRSGIQQEHGIQIKELGQGGVYRRYTP